LHPQFYTARLLWRPEIAVGVRQYVPVSSFIHATCDKNIARAPAPLLRAPRPNLVLLTTILASSLAFVDGSVVNVGLPAIRTALGAQSDTLQWVINIYLLPLTALLLLGGAAGDRFGRKRVLIIGTTLFALASAVCAVAPNVSWLLFGRAVQGIGAGILLPNSLAILGETFSGEKRGRAIGTWAAMSAVAGALGPVVGGWLIDLAGWRMIFLLNLPLAVTAIALAVFAVQEGPPPQKHISLDFFGGVLVTIGLALVTSALTVGAGRSGWTTQAIIALVAGCGLLLVFIGFEKSRGERAMMPLALFASRSFIGLTLLTLFLYGALGGLLVVLPYTLITAMNYSAVSAGASLLPLPLVIAVASPFTGALAGRTGARMPLAIGALVVAGGFVLFLRMDAGSSYWSAILPAILAVAIGMACAAAPLTTAVLGAVDSAHTGSASGFNSAVSRLGGVIATALVGVILGATSGQLLFDFHIAAIAGAVIAGAGSLSAIALISSGN
jgi:EmrB/QacA subfamily drug resistance transporter